MQMQNSEPPELVGNNGFFEAIDFPTEEELMAALEASLTQAPWMPRPAPAVAATSADLARHWEELVTAAPITTNDDEHYLSWVVPAKPFWELSVEPDFLAGLAKFLTDRLFLRLQEVEQAQRQLQDAVAKLQAERRNKRVAYNGK
ncbi:MAG TPA: hypothetical protein VFZ34_06335 [Blastocatellia bacterium]|nr:hypothetical protein [Blastocatellia bacterium]